MIRPVPPWPAMLIENRKRILVVSDLHLGYEFELAGQGINLPSQSLRLTERLMEVISETSPDALIILGDLKHTVPKISLQEWQDLPEFFHLVSRRVGEIHLTLGNHDGGISRLHLPQVRLVSSRGITVGGRGSVGMFHGHAWPSPKLFATERWIIGHSHPAVQLRSGFGYSLVRPVWVKARINTGKLVEAFLKHRSVNYAGSPLDAFYEMYGVKARCSRLIIAPAFNDLLGGLAVNRGEKSELLGPIMRSGAVELEEAELFLMDGTFLGRVQDLHDIG